eukprot:TRINITY_DN1697_c0_g1_i2.p1 TRINITY_DN1697_c0_g1~~TRINITY_DN1697_c0_g1_i2.p1  ORF type:complete len:168 (-),score=40.38 TRINITY_DN1697_c0_g1_i2:99-602(-)
MWFTKHKNNFCLQCTKICCPDCSALSSGLCEHCFSGSTSSAAAGLGLTTAGTLISPVLPFVGIPLAIAGAITGTVAGNMEFQCNQCGCSSKLHQFKYITDNQTEPGAKGEEKSKKQEIQPNETEMKTLKETPTKTAETTAKPSFEQSKPEPLHTQEILKQHNSEQSS